MSAWLSRNSWPIAIVLIASALVIVAFEVIDLLADSGPPVAAVEGEELEGAAGIAGLIKVALFLAVGVGLTRLVRRFAPASANPRSDD